MEIWFSCDEVGGEWTTGFGTSASGGSSIGCRSPGSDTSSDAGAAVMPAGDTNVGIVSVLITGDSVGFFSEQNKGPWRPTIFVGAKKNVAPTIWKSLALI